MKSTPEHQRRCKKFYNIGSSDQCHKTVIYTTTGVTSMRQYANNGINYDKKVLQHWQQ
jgi:hypothetical protein